MKWFCFVAAVIASFRLMDFVCGASANYFDDYCGLNATGWNTYQVLNDNWSWVKGITDKKCREQVLDGLLNDRPWATSMIEASSIYPLGIIPGNDFQLGDYDGCVAVRYPDIDIQGKYCLLRVKLTPKMDKYPWFFSHCYENEFSLDYNPSGSFLKKFQASRDPRKKDRRTAHLGICMPKACPNRDIERSFSSILKQAVDVYGYETIVNVAENSCSSGDAEDHTLGGKIVWFIIIVLIASAVASTVWDVLLGHSSKNKSKLVVVMESFSLRRNLWKLTEPNANKDLAALNGMKAMSMVFIILGHRCMASFGGPMFDVRFLEESYRSFPMIFLLNGILIVDTFFLIGGFLTFIMLTTEYGKSKKLSTMQVCFRRWLRITPDYMLMVFFYGYILENLGSGPVWSMKIGREAQRCRENWWTNFLYINNYANTDRLCMFQSWYVSCDMHYIMISPAIVKLVSKWKSKGLLILTTLVLISSAYVSVVTYFYRYDGIMKIYYSTYNDLASNTHFTQVYIKSHMRIIPYLSGMAAAYIYTHLKEANIKISKVTIWIFSFLAAIFALASICIAWIFYNPQKEYSALENALYASLHRVFWSLSMGWIAVATGIQAYGRIQPILSSEMFLPLSKLSYGAYLVHGAVQIYMTSSLRTPEYMNYPKLFWMTCGDVVLSFFFALVLHLLAEAPLKALQQVLFSKQGKTTMQ